jgi:hypothetical protein
VNLQTWLANGWLRPHQTSAAEIRDLWLIAGRDLKDAESGGISPDWQYGIAYNAALKLCTILLYAEGYRPEKQLAHYRTLQALPVILGRMMATFWKDAGESGIRWNMITRVVPPRRRQRS